MKIDTKTAVIIPVFNEEAVVKGVVNNVLKHYSTVVCIDDGSTDGSIAEIEKTKAYIIKHPINMGQGAALQTGIEFALSLPDIEYLATYDSDGQHRIEDMKTMVQAIEGGEYDVVLGSRFLGTTTGAGFLRALVLKAAVRFSNVVSGLKLTDAHNGLRVLSRDFASELQITLPDMAHASEILEIIAQTKAKFTEIPVTIDYTEYSKAKGQSLLNAINISFDILLRKATR